MAEKIEDYYRNEVRQAHSVEKIARWGGRALLLGAGLYISIKIEQGVGIDDVLTASGALVVGLCGIAIEEGSKGFANELEGRIGAIESGQQG